MPVFSLYDTTTGVVTSIKTVITEQEMIDTMDAINNPERAYILGNNVPGLTYIKAGAAYTLPPRALPWLTWNLSLEVWEDQRTQGEKDAALAAARAQASRTRRELSLELKQRSIMSQSDAILASRGEWPTVLQPFWDQLNALDPDVAGDVLIEWAGSNQIDRMDPNIMTIASILSVSTPDLDEIFGVQVG